MKLITQITNKKQKILIVGEKKSPLVKLLNSYLLKYQAEVFFSSKPPKSLQLFDYVFLINKSVNNILSFKKNIKIAIIFFNQERIEKSFLRKIAKNIKVIEIIGDVIQENDIERLLWFSLSSTKETYLKLSLPKVYKTTGTSLTYWQKFKFIFSPKKLIMLFIAILILIHILFIPPLIGSFIFIYQGYSAFKQENFKKALSSMIISASLLKISKKTYLMVRPTYLLFSLALIPDNLFDIAEKIQNITEKSHQIGMNLKEIEKLLFKKEKTNQEKAYLNLRFQKLKRAVAFLEEDLKILNQKIPFNFKSSQSFKTKLLEITDLISKLRKILAYSDTIFAKDREKKYLIFFANNMELRPGGGFLGSFGIIYIKEYTVEEIKIYDVYDADGQLTAHIEPPAPIRKYLQLPHWFLRDSNFSPDFLENYLKAQFFLEKEMKLSDFDGAILMTTTAIENILSAFGNIYLPDFKEKINYKNFYLKAQLYSEKEFFPGSIQKKTFLSAVTRQIIINLDRVSFNKLASAIKKSLDEKQIVLYFEEPALQELINAWYWSGRLITPLCADKIAENCISDYFFPYDANLGVNKANFFISRSFIFKTDIDKEGKINHLLSLQYKNDSPGDVFPGGTYRNFFQILLPKNIKLKNITKDGILIEEFTEKTEEFKNIGFFFEVPPKKTVEIKIDYQLESPLKKGKQVYQLITQKQIGASNSELIIEFNLPKNISLINQNFSPLVKEGNIVYNVILNTDKIFFLELIKR